jgi:hypothetical protein
MYLLQDSQHAMANASNLEHNVITDFEMFRLQSTAVENSVLLQYCVSLLGVHCPAILDYVVASPSTVNDMSQHLQW